MNDFDRNYRERLDKLSTTNVSDAMDALGYRGATYGIRRSLSGSGRLCGN